VNKTANPETTNMIRYLKMVMIGKEHNYLYCTLTGIHVFGKRMYSTMRDVIRDNLMNNSDTFIKNETKTEEVLIIAP